MQASYLRSSGALSVVRSLLEAAADINARDNLGWSCLHYAARSGSLEVAGLLLERKALICQTQARQTLLMLATLSGQVEIVTKFLEFSSVKDSMHESDSKGTQAIHCACQGGGSKLVKRMHQYRAKLKARDKSGKQPLHIACEAGKVAL